MNKNYVRISTKQAGAKIKSNHFKVNLPAVNFKGFLDMQL